MDYMKNGMLIVGKKINLIIYLSKSVLHKS